MKIFRKERKPISQCTFKEWLIQEKENYITHTIIEPQAARELSAILGQSTYDKLAEIVRQADAGKIDFEKMERLDVYFPIIHGEDAIEYFKKYAESVEKKYGKEILKILKNY